MIEDGGSADRKMIVVVETITGKKFSVDVEPESRVRNTS